MQHGQRISLAVGIQLPCDPQVLHVETEMSKILTRVLDPATSDELKALAEAQVRGYTATLHLNSCAMPLGRHVHHRIIAMTTTNVISRNSLMVSLNELQLVISAFRKVLRVVSQRMRELRLLQDHNAFVHLWVGLMSELHSWLTACKTKGAQGKQSYIFQSFESVYERHGSPGFPKV